MPVFRSACKSVFFYFTQYITPGILIAEIISPGAFLSVFALNHVIDENSGKQHGGFRMSDRDLEVYSCPLECTAFENCRGCPFKTQEGGKYYCHLGSKNFMYSGKAAKMGIFPLIFPSEVHRVELRYVMQSGKEVSQINIGDLANTKETSQVPVKEVMSAIAMDCLPRFRKRKR